MALNRQRGYAAIMVAMLVVMASLLAVVDRLDASQVKLRRLQEGATALQTAKTALLGYAISYRDQHPDENFGYLPCPDLRGLGTEQSPCGKAGALAIGLLPYKTLGLPELRDADGNCLWYAVSGSFKSSPKTVPFNWDTQGQISVRDADGRVLGAPDDPFGGVAAVVVSPGPALATQARRAVPGCGPDPAQSAAYLESSGNVFIQAAATDAANDRLAWITPKEIFDGIVRRGDFAGFMETGMAALQSVLGKQRAAAGNALPATNPFGRQAVSYAFYDGWKDQFRYFPCKTSGCYSDKDGNRYDGMLLFGGRRSDGSPRAMAARALSDYFESALPLARGEAVPSCTSAPPSFDNGSAAGRAADVVLCLPSP
jgi:type II secretory pathway pseudopilin PulG